MVLDLSAHEGKYCDAPTHKWPFNKGGEMAESAVGLVMENLDSWTILQKLQPWRFRIVEASTKVIRGGPKCPHHFQKITGKKFELSSFTCLRITVGFKCQCFKDFQVLNQPEHQ
nr:hypothetical protein CFP56_25264 [Quercus suber]